MDFFMKCLWVIAAEWLNTGVTILTAFYSYYNRKLYLILVYIPTVVKWTR